MPNPSHFHIRRLLNVGRTGFAAASIGVSALALSTSVLAFEAKPFDVETLNDRADRQVAETFAGHADTKTVDLDWQPYADFLDKYVEDNPEGLNLVRYADVTDTDHQGLKDMIADWTAMNVEAFTAEQKFAFFTNLYNALTLDVVLDDYPVETIRDIKIETEDKGLFSSLSGAFDIGPWSADLVTIGETALSLDEIEHSILRPMGDERVHYAVNCASIGCPDLKATPWTAESLEDDLDAAAIGYINSDRGLWQSSTESLLASKIFDWYAQDFGGADNIVAYMKPYAKDDRTGWLNRPDATISGYRYDWALNDAKTVSAAASN